MDISDKICLVTGATSGLGKAIATQLAAKQGKVVIVARNQSSGEQTVAEIKQKTKDPKVDFLVCDFASQKSIRQAVENFKAKNNQLNILINCAAIYKRKRKLTEDGLESMFAVNHLGYFLFTNLLLDVIKSGAPSRILNITAPSTSKLNFDDLQGEQKFSSLNIFGASKMANMLFTFALAKKLANSGVTVNAIHPGLMKTSLMHETPAPFRFVLNLISRVPEKAAPSIVNVAIMPEYADKNGLFFAKGKVIKANSYAYDERVQDRLWDVSLELTGL